MSDFSEIIKIIKTAGVDAVECQKNSAVLLGTVQSIAPLTIFIDQKTILDEDELILTRNVTDYKTQVSFDNPSVKQVYSTWDMEETRQSTFQKISFNEKINHDVTIYNGLKPNDKVFIMRMQGGQRFVVVDKVVS